MLEILGRIMNIADRVRNMEVLSTAAMGIFCVLLIFGVLNCILGYRLLRFWMMLFGFVIGAGLGVAAVYTSGSEMKYVYAGAALAGGVILALLAFLIYKVGIFILGAGLGLVLSIYILHPTTSFIFFLCILIGVVLGVAAMRYARVIIIVGTSLLGGALAGVSMAKLGGMEEIPYGIAMSVGFAALGMLIQFATNKVREEDEEDGDSDSFREDGAGRSRKRASGEYNRYEEEEALYGVSEEEIEEELEKEEAYERLKEERKRKMKKAQKRKRKEAARDNGRTDRNGKRSKNQRNADAGEAEDFL